MNDVKPCKFYSVKNTGKIQILWLLVFFNTCSIYNSPKVLSSQFRIISRFNKKACNRCSGFKTDCYRGFVEIVVLRYKFLNLFVRHIMFYCSGTDWRHSKMYKTGLIIKMHSWKKKVKKITNWKTLNWNTVKIGNFQRLGGIKREDVSVFGLKNLLIWIYIQKIGEL